ncbi:hypothetical protein [Herbiconiux sp. L3-i23]|uniref:hypothetical protein n=1 Tax=Herbiconiux sp. L3-i23 TaxID=2905871 RepID=UPI002063524A|nr:hypothetical protein [Herbiconiux sp. L3-i23]BDI24167.1 hypothetical protein L3i23_29430 [Herbiconiux sp. L3-i23]
MTTPSPPLRSDAAVTPGERRARRSRRRAPSPRRALALWIAGLVLTLLGFVGVVLLANSTIYSASGFVDRYLDAIERRDLATLLETPGVDIPTGTDEQALVRAALRPVDSANVVGTSPGADGGTAVEVEWADGDQTGTLRFDVAPAPAIGGIFTDWRFASSPVQSVAVELLHAADLRVNGVDVTPVPAGDGAPIGLAAFAPSRLVLDHDSRYLTAEPVTVVAGGATDPAVVDVQANTAFVDTVQSELDGFLDTCAEQEVLLPAGCPFGTFVENRLVNPPAWQIVDYPVVAVEPGTEAGVWHVPPTPGTARVTAEVISLFDGSRSALDESVPFQVEYRIEIDAGGALRIIGDS